MRFNSRTVQIIFWLILAAYAVYAAVFIYQTTFIHDGERYFVLFDDSMISMQYAKNLAAGSGLVWNAGGERVEGFTNLLWVVFMAAFHLLPLPASKISLALMISGALFFMGSLFYVRKIAAALSGDDPWVTLLSVFVCAFYYPFSTWSLLGTEVSILLLVTMLAAWLAIQTVEGQRPFSHWLYILLGAATLVRMDAGVLYLLILAYLVLFDGRNRRRHLLWGLFWLAAFLGAQTLFRLVYYGDLLPNTYYLKMSGWSLAMRVERGLYVLVKFLWNLGLVFLVTPLVLVFFQRDRRLLLLAGLFAAHIAYSVYVGGDAWEHRGGANRFIALGMPAFFILFVLAVRQAFQFLQQGLAAAAPGALLPARSLWINTSMAAFVFLGLLNFNTLLDNRSLERWVLLERSVFAPGSERYARDGLILKQFTTPQARILVVTAGNIPYFADRFAIDLLGKNDRYVAGLPIHIPKGETLTFLRPGHDKWDYAYSIGQLQPDLIVEIFRDDIAGAQPFLVDYEEFIINGHAMYLRRGSDQILWERVPEFVGEVQNIPDEKSP